MKTIRVFWKGKFNGALVTINAADFDPSIHRHEADGQWPKDQSESTPKDPGPKKLGPRK